MDGDILIATDLAKSRYIAIQQKMNAASDWMNERLQSVQCIVSMVTVFIQM